MDQIERYVVAVGAVVDIPFTLYLPNWLVTHKSFPLHLMSPPFVPPFSGPLIRHDLIISPFILIIARVHANPTRKTYCVLSINSARIWKLG